ncbi:MAG: hypothetical protein PVH88_21170 [Ignavibacteria bacterium]|jgi:hypothetical protein
MKIDNQKSVNQQLLEISKKEEKSAEESESSKKDSIEISDKTRAFSKLNDFLNLGKTDRLDMEDMAPGEKEEFLKMLSKLLEKGIVGYEYLEVDGKKEKHFIVNQIGNRKLYDAELYEEPFLEKDSEYQYKKTILAQKQ